MSYRIPKEWATLSEGQRGVGSLAAFKRVSKGGFVAEYVAFSCGGLCCLPLTDLAAWGAGVLFQLT